MLEAAGRRLGPRARHRRERAQPRRRRALRPRRRARRGLPRPRRWPRSGAARSPPSASTSPCGTTRSATTTSCSARPCSSAATSWGWHERADDCAARIAPGHAPDGARPPAGQDLPNRASIRRRRAHPQGPTPSGALRRRHHQAARPSGRAPPTREDNHVKLRYLAAIGLAGTLGLAACGSSEQRLRLGGNDRRAEPRDQRTGATGAAAGTTIRLWLNGGDTPTSWSSTRSPSSTRSIPTSKVDVRAPAVDRHRREADDRAVEQRQPRRHRARQHPGPGLRGRRRAAGPDRQEGRPRRRRPAAEPGRGRHLRRQVLRRALLRRRPHRRSTARTCSRSPGSRSRRRSTRFSPPASKLKADNADDAELLRHLPARARTGSPRCRSSGRTAATSPSRTATQWKGMLASTSRSPG